MDYLLGVDDRSRIGALRFVDASGNFLRTGEDGGRGTPPLLELAHIFSATRAVEMNKETEADLKYPARPRYITRRHATQVHGTRPRRALTHRQVPERQGRP
jgi:hypothetical protein